MRKPNVKIIAKAPKQRNFVAKELCCNTNFRPRVVKSKKVYNRLTSSARVLLSNG